MGMRERECGRRRGAMTKNSGSLGSWSCTHSPSLAMRAIARGILICRGSWPGGWGTGRGNTADYSTCLLDAHGPGADGRRQTADGRRQTADGRGRGRLPPPPWAARVSTLAARRSTPRWRSPKGPLRDRSGVITPHQSRPDSLQKPRCFFFFCPLSPPVLERGH